MTRLAPVVGASQPPKCCGCGLLINQPLDWRVLTETDELCPPCRTRRVVEHLALIDREVTDLLRDMLPIVSYGLLDDQPIKRALAYGRVADSGLVRHVEEAAR